MRLQEEDSIHMCIGSSSMVNDYLNTVEINLDNRNVI